MTGLGEDVYTDHKANREAALDDLVAESQRMGLYGDAPDNAVEAMVDAAGDAAHRAHPISAFDADKIARAALESLGVPLSVLAALRAGRWKAVPVEPSLAQCEAGYQVSAIAGASYHAMVLAAPKTPEAAR